ARGVRELVDARALELEPGPPARAAEEVERDVDPDEAHPRGGEELGEDPDPAPELEDARPGPDAAELEEEVRAAPRAEPPRGRAPAPDVLGLERDPRSVLDLVGVARGAALRHAV